jgi:hypothetical protein
VRHNRYYQTERASALIRILLLSLFLRTDICPVMAFTYQDSGSGSKKHKTLVVYKSWIDQPNASWIRLHVFVAREMEPAAREFEAGHYQKALALLAQHKGWRVPQAREESHYIRALCLQNLGRFDGSIIEYDWLIRRDCHLADQAKIGRTRAHSRKPVSSEQIWFPGGGLSIE